MLAAMPVIVVERVFERLAACDQTGRSVGSPNARC